METLSIKNSADSRLKSVQLRRSIPYVMPVIGFADDVSVFALVIAAFQAGIKVCKAWKNKHYSRTMRKSGSARRDLLGRGWRTTESDGTADVLSGMRSKTKSIPDNTLLIGVPCAVNAPWISPGSEGVDLFGILLHLDLSPEKEPAAVMENMSFGNGGRYRLVKSSCSSSFRRHQPGKNVRIPRDGIQHAKLLKAENVGGRRQ